jgi:SAM-dependent methyltransferase
MPIFNAPIELTSMRKIEYLSPAAKVSMADQWFEIASLEHFWVQRRFEVLRELCDRLLFGARLLQRQIEDAYGHDVTGFDLNEYALKQNVSRRCRICCYDIFDREPSLQESFDVILLFDVLEHIKDEDTFLRALMFHLAPQGTVILNVPAGEWAFSRYDVAAGHIRRYRIGSLRNLAFRNQLEVRHWTYWGMPLVPALAIRKLWLSGKREQSDVIQTGFDPRSATINSALRALARWERIPQRVLGASLMAVIQANPRKSEAT